MNRKMAVALSGVSWVIIGLMLLTKGLFYFAALSAGKGDEQLLIYIIAGLIIGFFKGRFVLSKTVKRVVDRLVSLEAPIKWSKLYSPGYLTLIGGMMLLGMAMRFTPIPLQIKGLIDVAVGSALVNGSMLYFRHIRSVKEYNE